MKNLERNGIVKKIISLLLILAMVLPYFPMSVLAAGDEVDTEKIQFSTKWNSNLVKEIGTTNDTFGFNYSFTLNGVPTGFQNVELMIETIKVNNSRDTITIEGITGGTAETTVGSGLAILNFGNVNQGNSISGQASVVFKNTDAISDRDLKLTLSGTYKETVDGEVVTRDFSVSKVLEANVTPATITTPYNADMTWQQYVQYGIKKERTPSLAGNTTNLYNTYNRKIGFYTNDVTATYPIQLYSAEKTQKIDLKVTINRFDYGDNSQVVNKMSEGYTINWDGLDVDLGTPTKTVNADGSETYTFSKGTNSNTYDSTSAFSLDKEYNVTVKYTTPHTNPETETNPDSRTNISFSSELNGKGFKLTKAFGEEETAEEVNITRNLSDVRGINLHSYTPGDHAWIEAKASTTEIGNASLQSSKITNQVIENLKNDGTATIKANVYTGYTIGRTSTETGYINFTAPVLRYIDSNGTLQSMTLTDSQMNLKYVSKNTNLNVALVNGQTTTAINDGLTVNDSINAFSLKLEDFLSEATSSSYELQYTLNKNALGLTNEEIDNIQSIAINFTTSGSDWISGKDTFTLNKETQLAENKISYMELDLGNGFDTNSSNLNIAEDKSFRIRMYKNDNVIRDTLTSRNYVVNENPVFFVNLPSGFEYDYDSIDITSSNSNIRIGELDITEADGEEYLVIPCIGTYDSRTMNEVDITISYNRTLLDSASRKYTVNAYMITDNENYYREVRNINEFETEDKMPDILFLAQGTLNVNGIQQITASTIIKRNDNKYEPNPSNDIDEDSEKGMPVIVDSNNKVVYYSQISSENESLENITILSRLPKKDNNFIEKINNQTVRLIETGYKLPESFFDLHGSRVNGINLGENVDQLSLQNLNVLGVYKLENKKSANETKLSPSEYTIYFTTEENATFDSTTFIEYTGVEDLSQAKNIKVVLNADQTLNDGESFILKYEMTMPDESGMVGAETATRATKTSNNETVTLYSPAAYVINGDEKGTINFQKKFENYAAGVAAPGTNISGIRFKLQYKDEETGEMKFVKDSDNQDLVAITDSEGKASFANIPSGKYYIYEVTTFDDYSGISKLNSMVNLHPAETINDYIVENKLKRGNLVINKTWEDATERIGNARFKVSRINKENETLDFGTYYLNTDENDVAAILDVPYGDYEIEEIGSPSGWAPEVAKKQVTVGNDSVDATANFKNIPGKGILQIVKTVPSSETVEGLKFHIKGTELIDAEKISSTVNTEYTVEIGAAYPSNVTVQKLDNDTKAVITISDLYLGLYRIEEVDVPYIDQTEIEKYEPVKGEAKVFKHDTVNPVVVPLANNYKTGTLKVVKTSASGVDLSRFKVRITCPKTLYNTRYDETFDIPESGILEVSGLYIGDYTVTEVGSDYFNPKYGDNSSSSPVAVTVENKQTTTLNIYNELADGYVKIRKTLEGKTAEETAGIRFRIHGKSPTGANVDVSGEISDTETVDGVKYGYVVLGPVPAGGEYVLEEVESTVPNYFVGMEARSIDIKKQYDENNPYILNVDNKRGKGNLEITTRTIPEGGELSPIKYRVTEIEFNNDMSRYTEVGAPVELTAISGYSEMIGINAGWYKVELTQVPHGYSTDVPQLVEVPISETGYAEFEIEKEEVGNKTTVILEKEVVNKSGNVATMAELKAAKLTKTDNQDNDVYNEEFEAKIVNVATGKVYYVFFSNSNNGILKGIPSGRYEIEEVYKPKYLTTAYLLKGTEGYSAISETAATGKYYFDVPEVVNNEEVEVTIKIRNTIDTEFGFGGQDSKNNLSVVTMAEVNRVTRTILYVTDENGDAIPGVTLKLYKNGTEVTLPFENNAYVTGDNKKVVINSLPVGQYTIKVTGVPNGYVKPLDKIVNVYEGATMVTRIEVCEDKPTGSLTLSTKVGQEYTPRSKYKILDPATNKTLTFEKTSTGDYVRSKLPTATDTISLRAGEVTVSGIEVGNYQLGLVDLSEPYGVINTEPENLTITENGNIEKTVYVKERGKFKKVQTIFGDILALTEDGGLYYMTKGNYSNYFNYNLDAPIRIDEFYPELAGVKIKDFDIGTNAGLIIVDEQGKVWINVNNGMTCISNIAEHQFANITIEKCMVSYQNSNYFVIDNNGKLWYWDLSNINYTNPVCLNTDSDLENAKVVKVVSYSNQFYALDDNGKFYAWGEVKNMFGISDDSLFNNNAIEKPLCITDYDGISLQGIKIKDLAVDGNSLYLIDNDGELWLCAKGSSNTEEPECLTKQQGNILNDKKFELISGFEKYRGMLLVDNEGKLWAWSGDTDKYHIGVENIESNIPVCVTDDSENDLQNVKLKYIAIQGDYAGAAIDENGQLWVWGEQATASTVLGYAKSGMAPKKVNFPQDAYFDLFEIRDISLSNYGSYNNGIILDKSGKLWMIGALNDQLVYTGKSFINYNSKEIATALENTTIKTIKNSQYNAAFIDSNNKLWTIGKVNLPFVDRASNSYVSDSQEELKPLCITDIEGSGIAHKDIVYVDVADISKNNGTIAVIDSEGKLYIAGSKYSANMGYAVSDENTTFDYTKYVCLNTMYSSLLGNVRFTKVSLDRDSNAIAVDSEGRIWTWGVNNNSSLGLVTDDVDYTVQSYTKCITPRQIEIPNNPTIVDAVIANASYGLAVDDEGKVYTWSSNNKTPILLTSDDNLLAGKNIVKIGIRGSNGRGYVVDNNGELFEIDIYNNSVAKSITSDYDIVAKDIYTGYNCVIIKDMEDGIWGLGSVPGVDGSYNEPTRIDGYYRNELYGIQPDEIIDSNTFVVNQGTLKKLNILTSSNKISKTILGKDFKVVTPSSSSRYIWYIDENGNLKYDGGYSVRNINANGKTFSKIVMANSSSSAVALADDGTVYKLTQTAATQVPGLTNIRDAWAYYSSDIYGTVIFAQDNNGNLWFVTYKNQSNATVENFARISGISTTISDYTVPQEVTAYTGGKIKDLQIAASRYANRPSIVICLDENNDLYGWGNNLNGILGTGNTTAVTTPTKITNAGKVKRFRINCTNGAYDPSYVYAINQNNELIYWSTNNIIPSVIGENFGNTEFINIGTASSGVYPIAVIDNNGDAYTISEVRENGTSVGKLTKIRENVDKIGGTTSDMLMLKKDGYLYKYSNSMETCLSDQENFANAFVKKFYLIKDAKYNN